LEIVVVGILRHASIEERPREVVDGVLFVLDGSCYNLGVEVVVKAVIKMRLHTIQQQLQSPEQLRSDAATTALTDITITTTT